MERVHGYYWRLYFTYIFIVYENFWYVKKKSDCFFLRVSRSNSFPDLPSFLHTFQTPFNTLLTLQQKQNGIFHPPEPLCRELLHKCGQLFHRISRLRKSTVRRTQYNVLRIHMWKTFIRQAELPSVFEGTGLRND